MASGANAQLMPAHIEKAKAEILAANTLIMQLETPLETVSAAAKLASDSGVKVILNPAPACALDDALLQHVSIFTPNETEAEFFTGIKVEDENSAREAAHVLLKKGIQTVLITMGAQGVFIATAEAQKVVAGFKVDPVDTTAAGDVFNGALAVALAENKALEQAVRFANAAAALSVTKLGAQPSAPLRAEVEQLLEK